MNILQILPELNVGGVERGTVDLAKYLARKGHKSIVVSWGGRLVENLDLPGIKHYKLPVHKKSPFTIMSLIPKLAWILKNEEIDIIHARSRVPGIISYFAYRRYVANSPLNIDSPISFITTCHGYYNNPFFSQIMGQGKLVVVASHVIGRHMNVDFNVPLNRIRLIPRGVDVGDFSYQAPGLKKGSNYKVGMLSRLTPWKGHENFLRAMAKVVRAFTNTKILIAGNVMKGKEDYKRKLDLLIKLLGIKRQVEFVGVIEDVPSYLHELDLLVSSSTSPQEAFGRVIIEGFACGTPVVATAIGGAVEVITSGKDGILVPVNQPHVMAKEIRKLLKDRRLCLKLSQNARKTVEKKYSLKKMMNSTVGLYRESSSIFKILVINWGKPEEILLSLPSLKALRGKFDKAVIYVATSLKGRELLSKINYIDEVLVCQRRNKKVVGYRELWKFSKKLRRIIFDVTVDLKNSKKSHLLSYLSGAPKRVGLENSSWDFFLNQRQQKKKEIASSFDYYSQIMSIMGIEDVAPKIDINITEKERNYVDNLLKQEWLKKNEPLIGISPFNEESWDSKIWPFSRQSKLIDRFSQENIRVIIIGEAKEKINELNKMTNSKPIVFHRKFTFLQLAALLERCKVVITSHNPCLYLAEVVGVPCISLFGPTHPGKHLLPNSDVKVLRKDLGCSPCYEKNCSSKKCMKRISVDEVFESSIDIIGENSKDSVSNY